MSAIITCDLPIFIDCDRPKTSRRGGKPPNCNSPTRPIALGRLELCLIAPCVVRRDCLTRNLDDAHFLRSQRSVGFDSRCLLLRAGGQEGEQYSDECGAHTRPKIVLSRHLASPLNTRCLGGEGLGKPCSRGEVRPRRRRASNQNTAPEGKRMPLNFLPPTNAIPRGAARDREAREGEPKLQDKAGLALPTDGEDGGLGLVE